jgi:hypothetical protein
MLQGVSCDGLAQDLGSRRRIAREQLVACETFVGSEFTHTDALAELTEEAKALQHGQAQKSAVARAVETEQRIVGGNVRSCRVRHPGLSADQRRVDRHSRRPYADAEQ